MRVAGNPRQSTPAPVPARQSSDAQRHAAPPSAAWPSQYQSRDTAEWNRTPPLLRPAVRQDTRPRPTFPKPWDPRWRQAARADRVRSSEQEMPRAEEQNHEHNGSQEQTTEYLLAYEFH